MPPRYSYWTIIAGGLPTAFRAADREELLPTFTRIKLKHPDAQMRWFARGKLWDSPESARLDTEARRAPRGDRDTGQRRTGQKKRAHGPAARPRGRDWRPGGEHRDPRQPYKDAKQARNTQERKRKFERRQRFADARGPDSIGLTRIARLDRNGPSGPGSIGLNQNRPPGPQRPGGPSRSATESSAGPSVRRTRARSA